MRYLPLTADDRHAMLAKIGALDIDALFADVPANALLKAPVDLPRHMSELEVERLLGRMNIDSAPRISKWDSRPPP